jgi:hypothetical protein
MVECAWQSDRKELPGNVQKMKETGVAVSTCGRELLREWWRPIGLMVSCMIFTASVRTILDSPSYILAHFLCVRQLLVHAASTSPYLRFCREAYWGCLIENCGTFWVASGFSHIPSKPVHSGENMWETVVMCFWRVVWKGNKNESIE